MVALPNEFLVGKSCNPLLQPASIHIYTLYIPDINIPHILPFHSPHYQRTTDLNTPAADDHKWVHVSNGHLNASYNKRHDLNRRPQSSRKGNSAQRSHFLGDNRRNPPVFVAGKLPLWRRISRPRWRTGCASPRGYTSARTGRWRRRSPSRPWIEQPDAPTSPVRQCSTPSSPTQPSSTTRTCRATSRTCTAGAIPRL